MSTLITVLVVILLLPVEWGVGVTPVELKDIQLPDSMKRAMLEIGVDKNTTVDFPAPIMTTFAELGSFMAGEKFAALTHAVQAAKPEAPAQSAPAPRSNGTVPV